MVQIALSDSQRAVHLDPRNSTSWGVLGFAMQAKSSLSMAEASSLYIKPCLNIAKRIKTVSKESITKAWSNLLEANILTRMINIQNVKSSMQILDRIRNLCSSSMQLVSSIPAISPSTNIFFKSTGPLIEGRGFYAAGDMKQSISQYQKSLQEDPTFVLAWRVSHLITIFSIIYLARLNSCSFVLTNHSIKLSIIIRN